ncbi:MULTISPECIES: hypothetical protein [unclassified Streptomyces]|uniref:hypothetical protein n=1 Tax=unclassified Streptomyces TaxID=2593676 RepID=UPI00224F659C|nr:MULTISPECIES: hypothetical protein [unclassified Streptomyces]MCX4405587.1 hypothetical protein [Streptomyces sp. NBC_01764]MCX5189862.1 hypothetical protein [Streptomyces sp. NBC_00268]
MSDPSAYEIHPGVPSVEDYRRLRTHAGLSDKSAEGAAVGLAHTWYGVVVVHGRDPVGMGRIIGDGGCFFQIVDICGGTALPRPGRLPRKLATGARPPALKCLSHRATTERRWLPRGPAPAYLPREGPLDLMRQVYPARVAEWGEEGLHLPAEHGS